MKILGVDPHVSKPYAWSLWVDGKLTKYGKADDVVHLSPEISGCQLVCVEDQYLNKSFKTSKQLSWSAGKVMGVAELLGKECIEVNVATWKGALGLLAGKTKETPKEKVRKMIELAKTHSFGFGCFQMRKDGSNGGLVTIDEDVASAILIGLYATRTFE